MHDASPRSHVPVADCYPIVDPLAVVPFCSQKAGHASKRTLALAFQTASATTTLAGPTS